MTDTLTTDRADEPWVDPGCGCCKPPAPPTVADQVAELRARREAVERRLADLQGGQR